MKIITVSGAHSGVGKTMIAEKLFRALKGWSAIKVTLLHKGVCPTGRGCGACDEMESDFTIVSNKDTLEKRGKDTARFKKAGAKEVLWLRAKPEGLGKGLKNSISKLRRAKGIIIEGTSVLKYINPDLAVFVKNKDSVLTPRARQALKKADLVLTL